MKSFCHLFFSKICVPSFCVIALVVAGCSDDDEGTTPDLPGGLAMTEVASGLQHPWGMAFLPDGRLLITERTGSLRILGTNGQLSAPLTGVPFVYSNFQGGLLDVAIDPNFEDNQRVYLSFAEEQDGLIGTAVGRGVLAETGISNFTVLFRVHPKTDGGAHFGSRILLHDDHLYLTLGDRFQLGMLQDLSTHLGTVIRIRPNGDIPSDNPFVDEPGAQPEIWTWGHRNVQGIAVDPATNAIWVSEHGPAGGDELNRLEVGGNYGWPLVSWGDHYDGEEIPDPTTMPEFNDAALWWTPAIAPAGMDFYSAPNIPAFQGKLLLGGLQARGIVVIDINGSAASEVDRIDLDARTRDVKQAPDGSVYVLTDEGDGRVIRIHME